MSRNASVSQEIQDEHLDMLIYLAFKMEEEEEIQSLIEEGARELTAEELTHKDLAYAQFLEKFDAQQRKEKREQRIQSVKHTLPKLAEIAACLVLVLVVTTSIAVAHVESFRMLVMNLLIEMQEDHASVRMIESDGSVIEIPAEWKGEYFPTYIPEGYVIKNISNIQAQIEFVNVEGDKLFFGEYESIDTLNMDIEPSDAMYIDINGNEALFFKKEGLSTIVWQHDHKYFYIACNMNRKELITIAQSIRMKNE